NFTSQERSAQRLLGSRRLLVVSYTRFLKIWLKSSGSNSVVECQLPKLDVAGSSPVSRSSNHKDKAAARTLMLTLRLFNFVARFEIFRLDGNLLYRTIQPDGLRKTGATT